MNKFCKLCGTLLDILEDQSQCALCNKSFPKTDSQQSSIQEKIYIHQTAAEFLNKESRPTTDEECPKCGHSQCYYSAQQMRSADEGQTIFYECKKCGFKFKTNT